MELGDDKRLKDLAADLILMAAELTSIADDMESDEHTLERKLSMTIEQLDAMYARWVIAGAERRRQRMTGGERRAAEILEVHRYDIPNDDPGKKQ